MKTWPGTWRTFAGAQREDERNGAGPQLLASDRAAVALTPLILADRFLPVSHDFGPSCSDGPAFSHCQALETQTPPSTSSLLAAYDACATPKEQEMLLSTVKCGRLQR